MKINNSEFQQFFKNYHLRGFVPSASIEIENHEMRTIFKNWRGDLRGRIIVKNVDLPDAVFGIYYTDILLRYLTYFKEETIDIVFDGTCVDSISKYRLKISNGSEYLIYRGSPKNLVDADGKVSKLKNPPLFLNLYQSDIDKLIKAHTSVFTPVSLVPAHNYWRGNYVHFGNDVNEENIHSFYAEFMGLKIPLKTSLNMIEDYTIYFDADIFVTILKTQSKNFDTATLSIYPFKAIELTFTKGETKSQYLMRYCGDNASDGAFVERMQKIVLEAHNM